MTNYRSILVFLATMTLAQTTIAADVALTHGRIYMSPDAKPIADGIAARTKSKPLAVIACENMINATDALKALRVGVDAVPVKMHDVVGLALLLSELEHPGELLDELIADAERLNDGALSDDVAMLMLGARGDGEARGDGQGQ